jgi:DnaJ-class molecular chaperone
MFDPTDPNKGKRFLLRIIAASAAGMTPEEFAEAELQRMTACKVCSGTGTIAGILPCPLCNGDEEDEDDGN